MQALVDYAKANPGKLSYGVGNSTTQIVMEALKKRTGTDIVRVPYRSNPMVMTDLLGGQIQIMVADFNTGLPQLKAGKVNALAVLTRDRNPALPDVPTLSETVMPGYHILAWAGMFGPAGMPPEAVKMLAAAVQKALDNPEVRKRFAGAGHRHLLERPAGIRRVREDRAGELDRDDQGGRDRAGMSGTEPASAALEPLNQPPDTPSTSGQFPRLRPWPQLPSAALPRMYRKVSAGSGEADRVTCPPALPRGPFAFWGMSAPRTQKRPP